MLDFKGFSVAVVDKDGEPFKEWGEQRLGNITSCYIESEPEKQFKITIQPFRSRWKMLFTMKELGGEYNMLATLRLDGKEAHERRVIVYVDEQHKYFPKHTGGEVTIAGKKVEDKEGNTRLYQWVFKEVGIELLVDNLSLTDSSGDELEADKEKPLAAALGGLGIDGPSNKNEKPGRGVIALTLERVRVARSASSRTTDLYAEIDMGNNTRIAHDKQHVATSTAGEIVEPSKHEIAYTKLFDDEGVYAKYKFFYRRKSCGSLASKDLATGNHAALQPVDRAAASMEKSKEAVSDDEDEWYVGKSRKHANGIALPFMMKK